MTKTGNENRQLNSLTQPILLDRLISHRGFKALAFVGTQPERVFAIDTDLEPGLLGRRDQLFVDRAAASLEMPRRADGGVHAADAVAPPAFARRPGGGGRSGSSVGEPGRCSLSLQQSVAGAGPGPRRRFGTAGGGPRPPSPPAQAAPQGRGAPSPGNGGGPTENVFVLASDGLLRALNSHNGTERFPAMPFLPANASAAGLILADGMLYTSTSNGCGSVPNGVYALDIDAEAPKPISWQTGGPSVAGNAGPALGTDGTIYVATSSGVDAPVADLPQTTVHASSVVALHPKTSPVKDWFTAPGADFNSSPVVVRQNDKDLGVVATGNDGGSYLLDSSSLGGADHKTALHVTAPGPASWRHSRGVHLGGPGDALDPGAGFPPAPSSGSS